jgi:hypothetical protein
MQKIHRVDEFELLRFTQCPLRRPGPDGAREAADAAVDATAESVLKWISWETYERVIPDLPEVREHAGAFFRCRYKQAMTGSIARRLAHMSRRLHDLVWFNSILAPQSKYELDLGLVRIEGSMTVVRSKHRASLPPRVIRLRHDSNDLPRLPDVVSLARWLYTYRESGFPTCAVLNIGTLNEKSRLEHFTESLAQKWLSTAALSWLNKRLYPSPGAHCKGCLEPCLTQQSH